MNETLFAKFVRGETTTTERNGSETEATLNAIHETIREHETERAELLLENKLEWEDEMLQLEDVLRERSIHHETELAEQLRAQEEIEWEGEMFRSTEALREGSLEHETELTFTEGLDCTIFTIEVTLPEPSPDPWENCDEYGIVNEWLEEALAEMKRECEGVYLYDRSSQSSIRWDIHWATIDEQEARHSSIAGVAILQH